ncbi:MAG TPA: hypothetical protein PLD73_09855 [Candidatus Hydrogenedentes bacterium]|jgi:ribosomal protein L37E|nr:hypothetical protein [Candidatus Hydrogenedentota bacterium]HPJ99069.1 hypothetical protein [Candidatus Hydrogenedentota bacterium]
MAGNASASPKKTGDRPPGQTATCAHCRYEYPVTEQRCVICGYPWPWLETTQTPEAGPERR